MATENLPAQIAQVEQKMREIPQWADHNATKLKWIGGAVACVVISPFVLAGIGGLIGGVVFIACGYAATEFAPVFARRVTNAKAEAMTREANRHLMALKAEAQQNPVPTLWNKWNDDKKILEQRRQAIVNLDGMRRSFITKLEDMRTRFGNNVPQLAKYEDRVRQMGESIEFRKKKLEQLVAVHQKKGQAIELAEGLWELALTAKEFDKADPRSAQEIFEADFKEKTAFDAIEQEWNQTGAELDQMMSEELAEFRPSKTLGFNPSEVIDVQASAVKAPSVVPLSTNFGRK